MNKRSVPAGVAARGLGVSERYVHHLADLGLLRCVPWSRPLEVTSSSVKKLILQRQPRVMDFLAP